MKYETKYLSFSDKGKRKENQDYFIAATDENIAVENISRGKLYIVADGLGGYKSGREAAVKTCETFFRDYYNPSTQFDFENAEQTAQVLKDILKDINQTINLEGSKDSERFRWGCTASALVLGDDLWHFVHTGDTRIYHFRDGVSKQLTEDHNIAFQKYKYGYIDYEEYLEGYGSNQLLSYIGVGKGVSVKTDHGSLESGDIFMICSDGLNQFIEFLAMEDIIAETSSQVKDSEELFNTLFTKITDIIDVKNADDNVTFLLILVS